MNKKEFMVIVAAIKSNYQNFGIQTTEQLEFWFSMLEDLEYEKLSVAVKKHIMTSTFAPTIADLRKAVVETSSPKMLDSSQAWGEVTSAIRNHGSYGEVKALESMSETTRNIVKAMGYKNLCLSETLMADRAHFIKMYESYSIQKKNDLMLSEPLKEQIASLSSRFSMDEPKAIESPMDKMKREYQEEYGEGFEE